MKKQTLLYLTIILLAAGCVPKQKYDSLLMSNNALQKEYDLMHNARRERHAYADSLVRLNAILSDATSELELWKNRYQSINTTYEEVKKEVASVRNQNEQLLSTASANNDALRKEIADRLRELDAREKDLRKLEEETKSNQGTIGDLKKYLSEKELRVKQLSDALNQKDAQMADLRTKIADILRGFNTGELTVLQENGKIYVALSDNLLFAKGSSQINPRGLDAIKKLASALNATTDVDIEVEGHTDSDGSADSNWSLSTSRALSVVKILTANKVDPKRIIASGRAFYSPIALNDTEVNKSKNRRTEIILSPKLDELYNIIKSDK